MDGRGTDLGAFLAAADVLVLRDGGCLLLVLPPDHLWPSEGDRQQALRRGDRLSLPRLQLIPRTDLLNWQLPHSHGLPVRLTWREAIPGSEPLQADATGLWSEQPCPWLYRTLQLREQGVALSTETLVADPQCPTGWRVEQLVSSGVAAANALGLTTQMPVQQTFLSRSRSRKRYCFGKQEISLRQAPRWQFLLADRPAGQAIRALAWLGPDQAGAALPKLRQALPTAEWDALLAVRAELPIWLVELLNEQDAEVRKPRT